MRQRERVSFFRRVASLLCRVISVQCFILNLAEGMPKDSLPASSADLVEKP